MKSSQRSSALDDSFSPEGDLRALIERYRTGPFRPTPPFDDTAYHAGSEATFGIDLRRAMIYADEIEAPEERVGAVVRLKTGVPVVLTSMLQYLTRMYRFMANDDGELSSL